MALAKEVKVEVLDGYSMPERDVEMVKPRGTNCYEAATLNHRVACSISIICPGG